MYQFTHSVSQSVTVTLSVCPTICQLVGLSGCSPFSTQYSNLNSKLKIHLQISIIPVLPHTKKKIFMREPVRHDDDNDGF